MRGFVAPAEGEARVGPVMPSTIIPMVLQRRTEMFSMVIGISEKLLVDRLLNIVSATLDELVLGSGRVVGSPAVVLVELRPRIIKYGLIMKSAVINIINVSRFVVVFTRSPRKEAST